MENLRGDFYADEILNVKYDQCFGFIFGSMSVPKCGAAMFRLGAPYDIFERCAPQGINQDSALHGIY